MWSIGLAFLFGDCLVQLLPELPSTAWLLAVVPVLLLAQFVSLRIRRFIGVFICAILWTWFRAAHIQADTLDPQLERRDVWVEGFIASLPDNSETDTQFLFDVSKGPSGVPTRIKLAWYRNDVEVRPGERWHLNVRLKRPNGFQNPGGFDYEALLFSQEIGATGYVRDNAGNVKLGQSVARYWVDTIRFYVAESMEKALPRSSMIGVLQGLAVGDTRQISSAQWQVFALTGTTHLMAISGLHIAMIAGLLAALGRLIVRWPRAQAHGVSAVDGEVVGGILGAIAYSVLAGLSVPTQRTLLMLCIYFAARGLRRELALADALGLALVTVLVVDPFAPLSVGTWLSFGAVAVIASATSGQLARDNTIRAFGRVQWAVTIGLAPLLIVAFGSLSLISPVANAAAIPLFTLLIVPLSLLGALFASIVPALGYPFLWLGSWLLELCWPALNWLADLPFAQWHFAAPSLFAIAALVCGSLLLIAPGTWTMRYVGVLLCVPAVIAGGYQVDREAFALTVLDVGQGLATVVRTSGHTLVFDTGPAFRSGRDAAQLAVLPYLYASGARRVDMLVVSHGDLDHRGGMETLIRQIDVNAMRVGPSVHVSAAHRTCQRGERWTWDGVEFEFLHPADFGSSSDNESSCVLLVSAGTHRVLLTGDIQSQAEDLIVREGVPRVSAVVAPHHGSATSSTVPFVQALHPEIVIFAVGYLNRWNFPRSDVVDRWRAVGARTFTTAAGGAITLLVDPRKPLQVDQYRESHRRYWLRSS
jgi:competence protein ComEC